MIDELRELYQEVILDHSRQPRNFGPCTAPTARRGATTRCAETT